MKLAQQLLINREWRLERQILINRLEVRTTTMDQQRMKLEQQPLINMEWSSNNNYWPIGN